MKLLPHIFFTFRSSFLVLLFSLFTLCSFAQQPEYPDSGFTNKAEATNLVINGMKEGKWCEYVNASTLGLGLFEGNDSVYKLTVYKNGNPYGVVKICRLNGKLWCEIPFKNGKENGIEKEYGFSPEGDGKTDNVCTLEIPWIDGEVNGVIKNYYDNGKLKQETTYKDGNYTQVKNYDENGNQIKQ